MQSSNSLVFYWWCYRPASQRCRGFAYIASLFPSCSNNKPLMVFDLWLSCSLTHSGKFKNGARNGLVTLVNIYPIAERRKADLRAQALENSYENDSTQLKSACKACLMPGKSYKEIKVLNDTFPQLMFCPVYRISPEY